MQVWEYLAIFWADPVEGEENTEVLLRKYPEDVKYSIISECKSNNISVPDLLNFLPYWLLKDIKGNIGIEELMSQMLGLYQGL